MVDFLWGLNPLRHFVTSPQRGVTLWKPCSRFARALIFRPYSCSLSTKCWYRALLYHSAGALVALCCAASMPRFRDNCVNIHVVGADNPNITLSTPCVSTVRLWICCYYTIHPHICQDIDILYKIPELFLLTKSSKYIKIISDAGCCRAY